MLKIVVFFVVCLFLLNSCSAKQLDKENLLTQAKIYTKSYINHLDLDNFDSDFYYYMSPRTELGGVKLDEIYHINKGSNTVHQIKILSESLEEQFYQLLAQDRSQYFADLAPKIKKEVFVYDTLTCPKVKENISRVSSNIGKKTQGKMNVGIDNRYYIFQHKTGNHRSVKVSITTFDGALPVISSFLEIQKGLESCKPLKSNLPST